MKKNKKGKALFFVGIWLCAFGFVFNRTIGIIKDDNPEFLSRISIPLLIVGIILLVASNFYKRSSS